LTPPPLADVVEFYRRQAPESLVFPQPELAAKESVRWRAGPTPSASAPATANLRWAALEAEGPKGLILCDMGSGVVAYRRSFADDAPWETLANIAHACRAEPADLDGNGETDLVVSDLGSFLPEDHDRGRVVWLHRDDQDTWQVKVLAAGLGRVADARPADFDGDGDQDLVVAEFGWHATGGIHLLENRAGEFHATRLDPRPGTIHVPVCDLNGDARPDFVALISQEYETIVAFMNDGDGGFSQHTLWSAGDPSYGSSGIEMLDFDDDDDLDVLYTNGDSFDSPYLKPSHGVHWLENRGELKFASHRIAYVPGIYRAVAGDVDGDGDLDLIASTFLPRLLTASIDPAELDSLVLLEQTSPGEFVYHRLEKGKPEHATLEGGDFDGDGDLDFAAGVQVTSGRESRSRAVIWWNEGPAP
jgi:hypothetical protein